MALQHTPPVWAAPTGELETLTISPIDPTGSTDAVFTSVTYGTNSSGAPVSLPNTAGKKTIKFAVLADVHRMIFALASPTVDPQSVNIAQGEAILATVRIDSHSGVGSVRIQGV